MKRTIRGRCGNRQGAGGDDQGRQSGHVRADLLGQQAHVAPGGERPADLQKIGEDTLAMVKGLAHLFLGDLAERGDRTDEALAH